MQSISSVYYDGKYPAVKVAKHRGYTAAEAADPELAKVIVTFKEAWDSFAANDAVRFSGLQTAYITHNEHPTGSKDQRDCAAGDEAKAE